MRYLLIALVVLSLTSTASATTSSTANYPPPGYHLCALAASPAPNEIACFFWEFLDPGHTAIPPKPWSYRNLEDATPRGMGR